MLNGQKTGTWTTWNSNGEITSETVYDQDGGRIKHIFYYDPPWIELPRKDLILPKEAYEAAILTQNSGVKTHPRITYYTLNGLKDGLRMTYDANGNKLTEEGYVRDTLNGMSFFFSRTTPGLLLKKATYFMGRYNGYFMEKTEDGKYLEEGAYVDGKKHGKWNSVQNGQHIIANYRYGILNGSYVVFVNEEPVLTLKYIDGKKNGEFTEYSIKENDRIRFSGTYVNNVKHGMVRHYKNNVLQADWVMKNGVRDGLQHYWYRDSVIKSVSLVRDNKIDSVRTTYYESGKIDTLQWYHKGLLLKTRAFYENSKPKYQFENYTETEYYPDGKKRRQVVYGEKSSVTTWDEKGRKLKTEERR